ncbi:MAG: hypothetical protein QOE86_1312 [Solirubrobacteraceae bacterium]|nr:hypothetical protein [Solirubrobacteraceae bacterium]
MTRGADGAAACPCAPSLPTGQPPSHVTSQTSTRIPARYDDDREFGGYDAPPAPERRVSLGSAMLRNWRLVLLPVIVLVAAAIALGLIRSPRYDAQAQLNVGSLDAQAQAVPGFVEATQTLASAYSRIAVTPSVLVPTARDLGMSVGALRGSVTVTPVIGNPLILITGSAGSSGDARRIAAAMSTHLVTAVQRLGGGTRRADALLEEFRQASSERSAAQSKLDHLRASLSASTAATRAAQSDLATAELRAQTAGNLYQNARSASTGASGVQVLQAAQVAGNDRATKLQQLGFVALAAGLVLGAALALARESRRQRRRI